VPDLRRSESEKEDAVEITEVRVKLMDDPHDRLQAFCSITFDSCFVVRDLKIIQGAKGSFVAMPSRKLTDRCPRCGSKNHLRAQNCNQCGTMLKEDRATKDNDGRAKLYADIAHPINSDCREMIQQRVIDAYEEEIVRAQRPDYICMYDDYGEDRFAALSEPAEEIAAPMTITTSDDRSHRVEPAATEQPGPHHTAGIRLHNNEPAAVEQHASNDSFGDGIV
jgi:stage V sporulation protein G